jgi:hypothetical protein
VDIVGNTDTLLAALFFASVFILGPLIRLPPAMASHRRRVMSFSGGVAVAYVFVRLLPELAVAGDVFVKTTSHRTLPFPELRVHLAAMLGFVLFYGLDKLVLGLAKPDGEEASSPAMFAHVSGFSLYVCMVSYLGVRGLEEGSRPLVLYAVALGCHFLAMDHGLRREYGQAYDRRGRFVLAAAALAGWVVGAVVQLPTPLVTTLLGFVSGSVIMNTMLGEVPPERDGRFGAFFAGCLLYTVVLLAAG